MKKLVMGLSLGAIAVGGAATTAVLVSNQKINKRSSTHHNREEYDIHGRSYDGSEEHKLATQEFDNSLIWNSRKIGTSTLVAHSVNHNKAYYNHVEMGLAGEMENVTSSNGPGDSQIVSKKPFLMGYKDIEGKIINLNLFSQRKESHMVNSSPYDFAFNKDMKMTRHAKESVLQNLSFKFVGGEWLVRINSNWTSEPKQERIVVNSFSGWKKIKGQNLDGLLSNTEYKRIVGEVADPQDTLVVASGNILGHNPRAWSIGITQRKNELFLSIIDATGDMKTEAVTTYTGNMKILDPTVKDKVLVVPSDDSNFALDYPGRNITFENSSNSKNIVNKLYRAYLNRNEYKYIKLTNKYYLPRYIALDKLNQVFKTMEKQHMKSVKSVTMNELRGEHMAMKTITQHMPQYFHAKTVKVTGSLSPYLITGPTHHSSSYYRVDTLATKSYKNIYNRQGMNVSPLNNSGVRYNHYDQNQFQMTHVIESDSTGNLQSTKLPLLNGNEFQRAGLESIKLRLVTVYDQNPRIHNGFNVNSGMNGYSDVEFKYDGINWLWKLVGTRDYQNKRWTPESSSINPAAVKSHWNVISNTDQNDSTTSGISSISFKGSNSVKFGFYVDNGNLYINSNVSGFVNSNSWYAFWTQEAWVKHIT